jgi:hypothetical protein
VELRRATLLGDQAEAKGVLRYNCTDVRRDLRGRDLGCHCALDEPCTLTHCWKSPMQRCSLSAGGENAAASDCLDSDSIGVMRFIAPRVTRFIAPSPCDASCCHQQGRTARGHLVKGHVAWTAKAPLLRTEPQDRSRS